MNEITKKYNYLYLLTSFVLLLIYVTPLINSVIEINYRIPPFYVYTSLFLIMYIYILYGLNFLKTSPLQNIIKNFTLFSILLWSASFFLGLGGEWGWYMLGTILFLFTYIYPVLIIVVFLKFLVDIKLKIQEVGFKETFIPLTYSFFAIYVIGPSIARIILEIRYSSYSNYSNSSPFSLSSVLDYLPILIILFIFYLLLHKDKINKTTNFGLLVFAVSLWINEILSFLPVIGNNNIDYWISKLLLVSSIFIFAVGIFNKKATAYISNKQM